MRASTVSQLLAVLGLATLSSNYVSAQSAAPGLIFPFYSVQPFSINATAYEHEVLAAVPNATNPLYIVPSQELENGTSTFGPVTIQGQGVGTSTNYLLANLTAVDEILNINGSSADSFSFTVSALNVNPVAYTWYGQILNGTGNYLNAKGVVFGQSSINPVNVTNPSNFILAGPTYISGYLALPVNATNLAAALGGM